MRGLFSGARNTALTLAAVALLALVVPPFVRWAFIDAVWKPDAAACRAAHGACWGFIVEKHRFILFGTYPYEEHWRPALASLLLVALWVFSLFRSHWKSWLAAVWMAGLAAIGLLMWGGIPGMPYVDNERWGGLILTLLLATFGVAAAFPIAVLLALGRRSGLPAIQALCVAYIELVRGVPLISLLFMASVMVPLFLPAGVSIDKLVRAQLALILFVAAYLAEVVRGGLQAVPRHQYEAADALGLNAFHKTTRIVLPQALRIAVPPIVNTVIGLFKDTSLVVVIGLFDLLHTIKVSLNEPAWAGFGVEAYLFAAFVYFAFCYSMSRYSRTLELRRGDSPRPSSAPGS
ncbi:MAG: amino acid ABC transporter permease, partial [Betaproteobacteria bacterium]|nr:amino acid ABC transporter permease [Betaproteobacteria bacterium]